MLDFYCHYIIVKVSAVLLLIFFFSCLFFFRLEQVFPDPRTCLLNQKLQLLNCCISRRIAREKRAMKPIDDDSDSDLDDEFFDCSSDAEVGEEEPRRRKIKHMPWDKPTGRLARHGKFFKVIIL